jgi:Ca-activated chloride channel family protein
MKILRILWLLPFIGGSLSLRAESLASKVKKGNVRYDQKMYDQALQIYSEALLEAPDRLELNYNLANTFYRQGKHKEAAAELKKAMEARDSTLQSRAHYNLGNTYFQAQQYQQAVEEYIKTLQVNPKDTDTKYNLELALKKLEEQKQQSQDKKQDQKQDPDKQQSQQDKDQKQENQKEQEQPSKDEPAKDQKANPQKEEQAKSQDANDAKFQPKDLSRQDAEKLLQAMETKEREELLRQLQKIRRSAVFGRDW